MAPKADVVKSLLDMGIQVDSRRTQSRLESQLERLDIQKCLSQASAIDLNNLCKKYYLDTRPS